MGRWWEKNHFYFRLDSSPVPPSPSCWTGQLAVYTAAAMLAGQLFPYIVVKNPDSLSAVLEQGLLKQGALSRRTGARRPGATSYSRSERD